MNDCVNWKERLSEHCRRFPHPAWGPGHARRVYDLALQIASAEGANVDADVLFAAACLHDMGAFDPYRRPGVDHAERSAQVAPGILVEAGFPEPGVGLVCEIIRGHMFYAEPCDSLEATVFHDADVLDFLGAVGVARVLSIVGIDDWTPDLPTAVGLLRRFSRELPGTLRTASARCIGEERRLEMLAFLDALDRETSGCW